MADSGNANGGLSDRIDGPAGSDRPGDGGLAERVHARQSWRPPTARAAELLFSSTVGRLEPFVANAARLAAWYERLSQRAQPWPGWSPLSLELLPGEPPVAGGGPVPRATSRPSPPIRSATGRR